ncbi:hypothetical protein AAG906_027885 [Vitis piasezkii]
MCGGDDHLAWKCPVSSEACRGLRSRRLRVHRDRIGSSFSVWIYHLGVDLSSWQSRQPIVQDEMPYDSLPPPPLPLVPTMSQTPPYILHGHYEVDLFAVVQTTFLEDTHALASLLAKFRMLDIERYTGVGCPQLEGFRQRSDESISSFISRWQMKIIEIVDRPLQRGDSVLRVIRGLIRDPKGKELTLEGATWLMDLDGNRLSEPTNVDQLKKYYV